MAKHDRDRRVGVDLFRRRPPAPEREVTVSKYDRDRRVRREGKGYTVTVDGTEYRVIPTEVFGWCIFTGPNLDGIGSGYRTAEAAIKSLLG